MTNPDKYIAHESSAGETAAIRGALSEVFAPSTCIEKGEGTSKHAMDWSTGEHQFVAVEQRQVFSQENLLREMILGAFQNKAIPSEIDTDDPRLGETQRVSARMTRIGVGKDGLYELRHYDYNYEKGELQVLNNAMTDAQFEAYMESPDVQQKYASVLDQEFAGRMYTPSDEEWDDFKADLVAFPVAD